MGNVSIFYSLTQFWLILGLKGTSFQSLYWQNRCSLSSSIVIIIPTLGTPHSLAQIPVADFDFYFTDP